MRQEALWSAVMKEENKWVESLSVGPRDALIVQITAKIDTCMHNKAAARMGLISP